MLHKKNLTRRFMFIWSPQPGSNQHGLFIHQILSLARLPISSCGVDITNTVEPLLQNDKVFFIQLLSNCNTNFLSFQWINNLMMNNG